MTSSELGAAVRTVWWLVLVRGVLAILFGLIALFSPGTALLALVILFGVYAIIDGVMAIVLGVRHRTVESHWGWQVAQGAVSVIAGIIALVLPGVTALAVLFVIAFWSIVSGLAGVMQAFAMRRQGSSTWGWALAGAVLSVLFGILLIVQPGAGLITILLFVGWFAVVFGVIVVVWAFRLRGALSAASSGHDV
ncbi:HdeD family acid-resistance protein [Pseudonocardia sp. GCM10023141]|uniref:HdeD family acid-resistance protein n=1 Tax=Pseudonocardia sp. GCM10023141 TaxID=3252653 RepID=UPI00360FA1CF